MNFPDYDRLMSQTLKEWQEKEQKPRILLHVCCAPCLSGTIEKLVSCSQLELFWYNPNITDKNEHDKRLETLQNYLCLARKDYNAPLPLHVGKFDSQVFLDKTKENTQDKEGGKRCTLCFEIRLQATAQMCKMLDCHYFTTTLTVSPHKRADIINLVGQEIALKNSVVWLPSDFKKRDGYLSSLKKSNAYGLYRQNYCGCDFSKT